jgi:hypothetical protein
VPHVRPSVRGKESTGEVQQSLSPNWSRDLIEATPQRSRFLAYLVGKKKCKHTTVAIRPVGTSHSDRSKTLMHQVKRDPEPKARSSNPLGGKKRLKYPLNRLLVHPRPRVGNGDANSFAAILHVGRLPAP